MDFSALFNPKVIFLVDIYRSGELLGQLCPSDSSVCHI